MMVEANKFYIDKYSRLKSKFSRIDVKNFAVMLSLYTKLISSQKIKEITIQEIKDFFDGRMVYKKQYFENNIGIKNAYQFARKVLDYYSGK